MISQLTQLNQKVRFFAARDTRYFYTYAHWQLNRWRWKITPPNYHLSSLDLLKLLNRDNPALTTLFAAADRGEITTALSELIRHFRKRIAPKFHFTPADFPAINALIDPKTRQATIVAADNVTNFTFEFRGDPPVTFTDGIDWQHSPRQNIDWRWDLNRHAYFQTLGLAYAYSGDERYARTFKTILLDWLSQNPPGLSQPNWQSVFEVGYRVNPWLWAWHLFVDSPTFDDETRLAFLTGLVQHGLYLADHIERHVPNNHLLLEAKSLALLGHFLPEFSAATRWRKLGETYLLQEVMAQICPDGVHGERSTHYHRVISAELLEWLVWLQNNNHYIPPALQDRFCAMVQFEIWVTRPDGVIPLLSDAALEDTYLRFTGAAGGAMWLNRPDLFELAPPPDEATIWLLGAARSRPFVTRPRKNLPIPSHIFKKGGYALLRSGTGRQADYLAFDCGPFGYKPLPNHGHADALSFELYASGHPWLIDPGIYSTSMGQDWRNFFRGTRAHNTAVIDEQDQSLLMDTRRVYRPAETTLGHTINHPIFDFIQASHNGYQRLPQPVTHQRGIFFMKQCKKINMPRYWLVFDYFTGQGNHTIDLYFHLSPTVTATTTPATGTAHLLAPDETVLLIVPEMMAGWRLDTFRGETDPIQGWVSSVSGYKEPADTLRYRSETEVPTQFITLLYPSADTISPMPTVTRLSLNPDLSICEPDPLGLTVKHSAGYDYLLLDLNHPPRTKRFGLIETDARLSIIRLNQAHQPIVAAIVDGNNLHYGDKALTELLSPDNIFTVDINFNTPKSQEPLCE